MKRRDRVGLRRGWWLLAIQGLLLVLLLVFGLRYLREFSGNLTGKYRQQLTGTASTARLIAEGFFQKYAENLIMLANDPHVREMARNRTPSSFTGDCPMERMFSIHRSEIDALFLMDTTSLVIKRIGNDTIEPDHMMCIGNTMANPLVPPDSVYYSDIFINHKNGKAITLSCPVYDGGVRIGIVRWMITLESISRMFLRTMEGDGHTLIILVDEGGRLLSNEADYYIWLYGSCCDCPEEGERQRHPVIRSLAGLTATGSGILVPGVPGGCSAYGAWSEFFMGDRSRRIVVMMPTGALEDAMFQHRAITFGLMGVALVIILSMTVFIFITRGRKVQLETEARYLGRLAETQMQLSEERERRLSAQITGREQERQRISRELHDGLGQMLLALKLRLRGTGGVSLRSSAGTVPLPEASGGDALALLDQTITEVRRISDGLAPVMLQELGLLKALEKYCRQMGDHAGIRIDFVHYGPGILPDGGQGTHLFRIVQEGVTNAIRHSSATEVNVQLLASYDRITVLIQDNGSGIGPGTLHNPEGTGIDNMRDRATIMGGRFDIVSSPDEGTTITVKIPVHHERRDN
jgi:signal transduction histidine kinase